MTENTLGKFLMEVSNWRWDDFAVAEFDKSYTTNQSLIFALVRACAMQKIDAIKLSLNRLDGKLKTPVKIEYPKIYYKYPLATLPKGEVRNDKGQLTAPQEDDVEIIKIASTSELLPPPVAPDLPTLSIRQTLAKMADYPRDLPDQVAADALQTEQWLRKQAPRPDTIPMVKSVVAAHLLILAQSRNIDAIAEVFDAVDGKLVETIQLLGEDIYITSLANVAPEGAYLNSDGVVEIEATVAQDLWAQKLGRALEE